LPTTFYSSGARPRKFSPTSGAPNTRKSVTRDKTRYQAFEWEEPFVQCGKIQSHNHGYGDCVQTDETQHQMPTAPENWNALGYDQSESLCGPEESSSVDLQRLLRASQAKSLEECFKENGMLLLQSQSFLNSFEL